MNDAGPYRQGPKFLLCPRCGEMLERAFDDVVACMRCEGVWVTTPTAEHAFETTWTTRARSMWWRNEIECPECTFNGAPTTMAALLCDDTLIDRCKEHGLWLDRGELGRLLGGTGPELDELRVRVGGNEHELAKLSAKREAWRKGIDVQRTAAAEYAAWRAADQARQLAEASSAAARAVAEADAAKTKADYERAHLAALHELADRRDASLVAIAGLENRLGGLRAAVRVIESDLDVERIKLRGIDDQLAKLQTPA